MTATAAAEPLDIDLLWFRGCPNHGAAEELVRTVARQTGVDIAIHRIEITDEATGQLHCFPGSPTVRIDGVDVEPGWEACEDCTPRCRVYQTSAGLRGLPDPQWIEDALIRAYGQRLR
ncbi:MAG: hypothetical protein AB7T37_12850 [Dehalococcoidia bacterium]